MATPIIDNVICPNGIQRQFTIQKDDGPNKKKGFVKINRLTVSGLATRRGTKYRWMFIPNKHGKNFHACRTPPLEIDTLVRVSDPSLPEYVKKYLARIIDYFFEDGSLTATYTVQFNGIKRRCNVNHAFLVEAI